VVEKHPDGYVAYPLNLKGMVVGEGDTCEDTVGELEAHFVGAGLPDTPTASLRVGSDPIAGCCL
jgi:hypothetical protein